MNLLAPKRLMTYKRGPVVILSVALGVCSLFAQDPIKQSDIVKADAHPPVPAGSPARGDIEFNRDVRPILTENCFACHGPDLHAVEADLSLESFEHATRKLGDEKDKDKYAIVPGKPAASEAWKRINDSEDPMPPKKSHKKLSDEEKKIIYRWIEQGAQYQPHWAYVKPRVWPTPAVKNKSWPTTWIDSFILARIEKAGLSPVDDADRVALIRRLSFDLIGLPPTPEEVDAFVNDKSADAFERVVDRLLASPRYGERMAMYWLDLVRFADTVGYHGDQTQNITPYRDWVIWAFNENMPYNEFIINQVAGDLVEKANDDTRIASAYNRLQQTTHEGGLQLKEYAAIYDADRVRNFSETFMGATMGCAQCHDHKYDPYTARDFYSLAAFWGQLDDLEHLRGKGTNTLPTKRGPEIKVLSPLDRLRIAELKSALKTADKNEHKAIEQAIKDIAPRQVMISVQASNPRDIRFLARGDWQDETGDIMKPAVPKFMGVLKTKGTPNRLDLAQWLVKPMDAGGSGELTARVLVNRLWYLVFGEGLCTTLGDFGGQGRPPNHPELLDRLALELIDSGWDIKSMMKKLVMTHSYRLSSASTPALLLKDPNNELFARQGTPRLAAEMIRDNALKISGLLVNQLGGESAHPYQPAGYYKHLNFPKRKYKSDTNANQWRRGVYVHWQRQFLHPMLKAFDAPTREECTAKRAESNTPLAALVLLNDPTFIEAARCFAERILTEASGDDRARITWAMREALSRPASDDEMKILLSTLKKIRANYKAKPQHAQQLLDVGMASRDKKLDAVEHAAWAEICRLIFNLHETITRP